MTIRAHYDGHEIRLDESVKLPPDSDLLVTVLPPESEAEFDAERREWNDFALASFATMYEDEPDVYTSDMVKIQNPKFRGRI